MKRALLALLFLTFSAVSARAQFTSVTATPVKDPNGAPYVNCRGNGAFVPSPSATQVPLLSGSTFQTDVSISQCDSFGNMTITLADNNAITDGHTGSDVSKWRLNISSQDGKTNFSCTLTITGTTQDATAAIQACAAPLPPAGGGGGNFVVKPISCATNMVFTMAGVPPNTSNTAFTVNLNCNVTSSSVVGPSGGTIQQGAVSQFTLIQNNVGGFAFPWPSNFIDQPTIQGAANATTNASFWYDGTNWHAQTFPASGGGAANAAGILGDVQRNNGAGGLAVAGINDNGTTVRVNEDISFKGPNPYSDIMAYGGYSNASPPSTTASTTNGSTSVTLASALDFQDATKFPGTSIGNGIVIYKAGAATGLSTPPAQTVTPIGILNGSTTYNYKIVAEDLQGGLTAASANGTTTVGASALGNTGVTLTAANWNNTLNGQTVYTCSGNCNVSNKVPVFITGFVFGRFNGSYTIAAVPDATHFTVYSASYPNPPTTTSETHAATATVTACNMLTMPSLSVPNTVENATSDIVMRWWVYRNATLAFVIQQRDPYWEDCGQNAAVVPSYVPSSPPSSPQNKYLATTIVSGAGTTSIVVADAAGATVSGQTAKHDNSKNLIACITATKGNTYCYASYPNPFEAATIFTNSAVTLGRLVITGTAGINQPWIFRTNNFTVEGFPNVAGSFVLNNAAPISGNAYPLAMILETSQEWDGLNFDRLRFSVAQAQQIPFVHDGPFSFGILMNRVSFGGDGTASNVNTPAAIFKGATQSSIGFPSNQNACSSGGAGTLPGPPCIRFTTVSPASYSGAGGVGTVGSMNLMGYNFQQSTAMIQIDTLPWINGGGNSSVLAGIGPIIIKDFLREIGHGPLIRVATFNIPTITLMQGDDDAPNASAGNGLIDAGYMTGALTITAQDIRTSVGAQNLVAGLANVDCRTAVFFACTPAYTATAANGLPGISGSFLIGAASAFAAGGISVGGFGSGIRANDVGTIGYTMPTPAAPTVTGPTAGGSIPVGTYTYQIMALDTNGYGTNPSSASSSSCTTTGGNQTCTVTWTLLPGQIGTRICRNGLCSTDPGNGPLTWNVRGTSFVDTGSGQDSFGASSIATNFAASASLASGGVATQQLILTGTGFKSTESGTFTADRTITRPDASGTMALGAPFTSNGILFGNGTSIIQATAASGAGTFCLTETNGGVPTFGSCAGSAATAWSSLTNPSADLSLSMGTNNSLFTHGVMTGARHAWEFTDGASTSTGSLGFFHTGASSTMKPFTATAQGTANGAQMNTSGILAPIGTGGITANAWTPNLTANQLLVGNAGSISSLLGTLTGTNPVLTVTSAAIGNVPFAVNTPASPTADLFDLNVNSVKTAWFDNLGILHTPSATFSGSGPLVLSGTEGTCPSPVANIDILCLGDLSTHSAQLMLNGASAKPLMVYTNNAPTAHGVVIAQPTFPQNATTTAGTAGQAFVSGGASTDPAFGTLGAVGGGLGTTTNTAHGVLVGEGTSPVVAVGPNATANLPLLNQVGADPIYSPLPLTDPTTSGTLPQDRGGTGANSLVSASIATVTGVITAGHCAQYSSATVITDSGAGCGGGGGTPPLSSITAAGSANTINNTIWPQTWNWALTGSTVAHKFGENTAATGSSNILLQATTLNTSTAIPFQADNNGNGWQLTNLGLLQRVGTASVAVPGTVHGTIVSEGATAAIAVVPPGTAGQVLISNGAGADPTYQDPVVSQAYVNLWTTQDVTTTRTSAAVRNPIFSQTGTLELTWASITGSPATCTLQIQGVDSAGNALNNGSTFSVSPANGTTSQTFTAAASLQSAAQIKAIFACGTYPTTGTLTLDYTPIPNVNVTNTVTITGTVTTTPPANASTNVTQFGGVAVSTGTGASGTGIPRVTVSNDSSLAANQSVNESQINGVTPLMGNGVTGTGSQRVTIASDNTAFSVNATDVGNKADDGAAAGTDRLATLPAIEQSQLPAAGTTGRNKALRTDLNGTLYSGVMPTNITTYTANKLGLASAASATDIAVLPGNATNTVIVTGVRVSCTQTTAGIIDLQLIQRTTADTGGTSGAMTAVKMDTGNGAAVSAPLTYTANPTINSTIGNYDSVKLACLAPATASAADIYVWKPGMGQSIVLRGTAQQLAVNLNGVTVTGGSFNITFSWIETSGL